jgi:hypothetical protein
MAILCGLAIELDRHMPETGKLFYYSNLLKKMVAVQKSVFRHKIAYRDHVFALHNLPGYPKSDYS